MNTEDLHAALEKLLDDGSRVHSTPSIVERLSKDFYWYSPVLKLQLADKRADIVAQPVSTEEVVLLARFAAVNHIPITVRGAGTGNYGQCIPLEGGIVLDMSLMDKLEAITPDGVAVCQPGLRLALLETEARKIGWELRMYPSTLAKASVGGFLAGGSGGIGSVAHGGLRDFDTVRALEIVTMEAEPRIVLLEGAAIHEVLHCWGTNGILTRIWFALTPAIDWTQTTIAFEDYEQAFLFAKSVAEDSSWAKRLVTVFEWPIPSFFAPVKQIVVEGKTLVLIMIASRQFERLRKVAEAANGQATFFGAYVGPRTQPLLSDYTWNHTTLWAMKADPKWTYIQAGFSPALCLEQFRLLRARYHNEILFHIEFMKNGESAILPGSIPLVYFTGEERLNELIAYCREIGVFVANPHVNYLEDSGRFRSDSLQLLARHKYDPQGLLNPGKMISFHTEVTTK
uniref:FAD linked oxidase-like protein n=1 Tax=mine drainage metagenome TaxID=410659 RepID=E6QJ05_9ZZZZ